jgi:hypothetical protein
LPVVGNPHQPQFGLSMSTSRLAALVTWDEKILATPKAMANKTAIGMNIMVEDPLNLSCFRQLKDEQTSMQRLKDWQNSWELPVADRIEHLVGYPCNEIGARYNWR